MLLADKKINKLQVPAYMIRPLGDPESTGMDRVKADLIIELL
jgi:hypothetical protein